MGENTGNSVEYKVGPGFPPKEYQWKPGQSGNPSGRPKGSLKDYVRHKFGEMSDTEKEEFLLKVAPDLQWRMGEGNPQEDITTGGDKIQIPIYGGLSRHDGNKEDIRLEEK